MTPTTLLHCHAVPRLQKKIFLTIFSYPALVTAAKKTQVTHKAQRFKTRMIIHFAHDCAPWSGHNEGGSSWFLATSGRGAQGKTYFQEGSVRWLANEGQLPVGAKPGLRAGVLDSSSHWSPCGLSFFKTLWLGSKGKYSKKKLDNLSRSSLMSYKAFLPLEGEVIRASSQQITYSSQGGVAKSSKSLWDGKYCCSYFRKIPSLQHTPSHQLP